MLGARSVAREPGSGCRDISGGGVIHFSIRTPGVYLTTYQTPEPSVIDLAKAQPAQVLHILPLRPPDHSASTL